MQGDPEGVGVIWFYNGMLIMIWNKCFLACAAAFGLTSIAHAYCPPGPNGGLLLNRKLEALQIGANNASRIHRALDNVMDATGPYHAGDTAFDAGIDYVLSLQLDRNNMDIWIDSANSTNAGSFIGNWETATRAVKYRKRTEDDWTISAVDSDYQEDSNCLRRITLYSTGKNFTITNTAIPNPNPISPTNPQLYAANYSADRFKVVLQELPASLGRGCNFNFRVVSLRQITESRFPLPPVPFPAAPLNGSPISFGIITSPVEAAVIADPIKAVMPLTPCT